MLTIGVLETRIYQMFFQTLGKLPNIEKCKTMKVNYFKIK